MKLDTVQQVNLCDFSCFFIYGNDFSARKAFLWLIEVFFIKKNERIKTINIDFLEENQLFNIHNGPKYLSVVTDKDIRKLNNLGNVVCECGDYKESKLITKYFLEHTKYYAIPLFANSKCRYMLIKLFSEICNIQIPINWLNLLVNSGTEFDSLIKKLSLLNPEDFTEENLIDFQINSKEWIMQLDSITTLRFLSNLYKTNKQKFIEVISPFLNKKKPNEQILNLLLELEIKFKLNQFLPKETIFHDISYKEL